MKTFLQLKEDMGLSTGAGIASVDAPLGQGIAKRNKFAGIDVFDIDESSFHRCRLGKLKFKRWKNFVGEEAAGNAIREYANKNWNKPIILRCEKSGAMLFVRGNYLNFKSKE